MIADQFKNKWQFPNCLGAVDGKHVKIIPPPGAGSHFFNYKGFHSIVLMAIVNADYEFIYVDIGTNGRISDGGVLKKTTFYKHLDEGTLNIPAPENPTENSDPLPFVYIGDEAFALRHDFLKPYPQRQLDHDKRIYNYRICRARRIVENVFGILTARFQIFHSAINFISIEDINFVILACCALHNYLRRKSRRTYISLGDRDTENQITGTIQKGLRPDGIFEPLQVTHAGYSGNDAKKVREDFVKYFNTTGAVSWQERMINN